MKITKIQVQNYRLLKDFSIDIEDELSLVIGKNNCGKTSLLSVLDKFLNGSISNFSFDDFNLDYKKELKENIVGTSSTIVQTTGINLKIFIKYMDTDDLSNISKLMMDLDPNNNQICLSFEYLLTLEQLIKIKEDFLAFKMIEASKPAEDQKDIDYFLNKNFRKYYILNKKTLDLADTNKFIDLINEDISLKDVINFKYIKANRDVSNKEPDKSLSTLSSGIYEKLEASDDQIAKIEEFNDVIFRTDKSLDGIYESIFENIIKKVKKFGGIKPDDTKVVITSSLQNKDLLSGNTTVRYLHDDTHLPENYNGLGYMNLISMIFEIEIKLNDFKKNGKEKPADINILFIEEPEAHTHPQMQYIFIKNIKNLLKNCIPDRELQYIISTHSSHIVAESEFDDIKYLKRDKNSVTAKNLKDLEKEYEQASEDKNYKFLKQYLTLHRAELFFADKAIFIEGDTERILLPAMMKKLDQEFSDNPILSQNISIIEVGNYSHIFEKFINFFGIKSLIITDIDSAKSDRTKCKVDDSEANITTNASLKFFYQDTITLSDLKGKTLDNLKLKKDDSTKKWTIDTNGYLVCVYQTKETNIDTIEYHARSFEDAFFHLNRQFIIDNKDTFGSLKNISYFDDLANDAYTDIVLIGNLHLPLRFY